MLLEVYDGYEEGVDWQQQGFVNSIFGNCKAYDDVSGISEYEWSYRLNGSFFSSGSSRIMAKLDLKDIEQDATAFVCARAVNKAGLRSSTLCSDGVLKGKTEISVTTKSKETFAFGVDRLFESESNESIATKPTVFCAISFPNNSATGDFKLITGPV
jgi:hypothetical protein